MQETSNHNVKMFYNTDNSGKPQSRINQPETGSKRSYQMNSGMMNLLFKRLQKRTCLNPAQQDKDEEGLLLFSINMTME